MRIYNSMWFTPLQKINSRHLFLFQLKNTSPIKSQKSSTFSNIRWTTTHRLLSQGQEENYEGTEETHRRREQGQKLDKVSRTQWGQTLLEVAIQYFFNNVFLRDMRHHNQSQKQIRTVLKKYFVYRICNFKKNFDSIVFKDEAEQQPAAHWPTF